MVGAVERVRPKMMTVVAIMAGLLPILWSTGAGSEVMQRIAVPMIGGMVSSTVLTLVVIPAVYALVKGWRCRRATNPRRRPSRSRHITGPPPSSDAGPPTCIEGATHVVTGPQGRPLPDGHAPSTSAPTA